MSARLTRCTPSRMDRARFIATFGGIYEHSAWVAERAWAQGITAEHDTIAALHRVLMNVFLTATPEEQLTVVLAHPDLAGKAALRGELTTDSSHEQTEAGLDACTPEELRRFQQLNSAYRQRFGFPFIMAVKGQQRQTILAAFEQRLQHSPEQEWAQALNEINTIAQLRLNDC